ncbi:MAG TPA: cytochrome b N-terminal domain-containing protein [Planctomycetota bacterium]|nr:cytochrome b N-terminal domain-containing protein [Planctomycetota bacterium]
MRRVAAWLDDRLGVGSFLRASFTEKRPPRGIGWLRTLGFAALTILVLQVLSGIAIAFHYVPSTALAYDSIRAMEQDVPGGRFARALHYFGASAFVVAVALHLARVFFTGAYKAPRELTWLTGVGLFVVVLAFGFTGYLLPWDQKAYFATRVGTEIAGKAPLVGAHVRQILNGGDEVGAPTLTRFYVIHVVLLPLALFALLGLHLFLIQRHGVSPPGGKVGDPVEPGDPYYPNHTAKEAAVGALVALVLFWLAATRSAPLEAVAEPSDTGYDPRPDWYFAGLFQLLKLFQGPLEVVGSFWLPNLLLAGLVLLPFLDRNPWRHWRQRPRMTALGVAIAGAAVVLTWVGVRDVPHNEKQLTYPLGLTELEKEGYRLVRRLKCTECHKAGDVGRTEYDAPDLDEIDQPPDVVADILADPAGTIGSEDMPDFAHVDEASRYAIGVYLRWLHEDSRKRKAERR